MTITEISYKLWVSYATKSSLFQPSQENFSLFQPFKANSGFNISVNFVVESTPDKKLESMDVQTCPILQSNFSFYSGTTSP